MFGASRAAAPLSLLRLREFPAGRQIAGYLKPPSFKRAGKDVRSVWPSGGLHGGIRTVEGPHRRADTLRELR